MSYLPPTTDNSGVFALLSAVSDPEAAKARLAELTKATQEMNKTIEESRNIVVKIEQDKKESEKTLAQAIKERKAHEEAVLANKQALDIKAKEISDREVAANTLHAKVTEELNSVSSLKKEADKRMSVILAKEQDLQDRERTLSNAETNYTKKSDILNTKITQLKAIVNG